jgi:tetratricopeptide (TPR) repeat protein
MGRLSRHRLFFRRLLCGLGALVIVACLAMLVFESPQAHCRRAMAAVETNGFETIAYELLWLERNPRFEAQASLLSGTLLLAEGDLQTAPHVLAVAAANPDTQVRAAVLLGECLYKSGKFREAGEIWTRAVELDPDNADAHRGLAAAYFDLRAAREALVHLRRVAELDPRDPRPHKLIGLLCDDCWQPTLAIEGYEEALRRAPDSPDSAEIRFNLAKLFFRMKSFRSALEQLSHLAPSAEVFALTADCQHGLGLDEQARASLDEALRLDPKLVRALALKGQLLIERGDVWAAADTLELAFQQAPNDWAVLNHLATACQRTDQAEKAQRLRQTFDRLQGLDHEYEDLGLKALDDPRDAQTRYRLGLLAMELGAPALARTWFQAVVNLEPGNTRARAALQALESEVESNE